MLLESPQDPASYLTGDEAAASFWCFPEIVSWVGVGGLELTHLDQGALGHPQRKPTTITALSTLPQIHQLHEVRGEGRQQGPLPQDLNTRVDVSKEGRLGLQVLLLPFDVRCICFWKAGRPNVFVMMDP